MISPEGCASILWKSADKKEAAAEAMGLTAERLAKLGLVDEVLREPLGGAHRDPAAMADALQGGAARGTSTSLTAISPPEQLRRGSATRRIAGVRRVPEAVSASPRNAAAFGRQLAAHAVCRAAAPTETAAARSASR